MTTDTEAFLVDRDLTGQNVRCELPAEPAAGTRLELGRPDESAAGMLVLTASRDDTFTGGGADRIVRLEPGQRCHLEYRHIPREAGGFDGVWTFAGG
jgi:hypothetical protein